MGVKLGSFAGLDRSRRQPPLQSPNLRDVDGREDGRKRVPQEKRRGVRGKFGASGLKNPHPAKRLLFPTSQMPKDTR
jgi:hypothetical protein